LTFCLLLLPLLLLFCCCHQVSYVGPVPQRLQAGQPYTQYLDRLAI
jgi:hypothetical protein